MKTFIAVAALCLLFSACAIQPWEVDDGRPGTFGMDEPVRTEVASFIIVNLVDDYTPEKRSGDMTLGFGTDKLRLYTSPSASMTVEADLKQYFADRLTINPDSHLSIRAVINGAVAYRTISSAQKIPIVGLLAVTEDTEWGLALETLIEVQVGGKIERTYHYDDITTILGESTTKKVMQETYSRLLSKYREQFYGRMDSEFIGRYL